MALCGLQVIFVYFVSEYTEMFSGLLRVLFAIWRKCRFRITSRHSLSYAQIGVSYRFSPIVRYSAPNARETLFTL